MHFPKNKIKIPNTADPGNDRELTRMVESKSRMFLMFIAQVLIDDCIIEAKVAVKVADSNHATAYIWIIL